MLHFQRIESIGTLLNGRYISFIGSGGKTTFIEFLAAEAIRGGKSAAVTTTTKIYAKEPFVLFDEWAADTGRGQFVRTGKSISGKKLTAIGFDEVERLGADMDFVFIEADGSKRKPVKFPAEHEPVIPLCSDSIFIMCGLDGLSGQIRDVVFRWELFSAATGIGGDSILTPSLLLRFFEKDGFLKGVNEDIATVILNKYDAFHDGAIISNIVRGLFERTAIKEIIVTSLMFKVLYRIWKD